MAQTHVEPYRHFRGERRQRGLRAWPLMAAGVRVATKRKLPLFLLLLPPVVGGVVASVFVYAKFVLHDDTLVPTQGLAMGIAKDLAANLLEVRRIIMDFNMVMGRFCLLVVAWFGAGLISEDRRQGAQLLYFTRPITRFDYFLGKLGVTLFFGMCAQLVPSLLICLVATFTSPDWSFLKEHGDAFGAVLLFWLVWSTTLGCATLAISSLAPRRSFALVGCFAVLLFLTGSSVFLTEVLGNPDWKLLDPVTCFQAVGEGFFDFETVWYPWPLWKPLSVLGGIVLVSLLILVLRLRRMEVRA